MRVIQYFLFIYFCYCHDLHHADPVSVKQPEPPVAIDPLNKHIETTNVQKNQDTVQARFQATHDLRKPTQESHPDPLTISNQNDLTLPETPSVTGTVKNTPTSSDKTNPKIIQKDTIPTQSQHIPSTLNTVQNSNTLDKTPDPVPVKSTEAIINDSSNVQSESPIPSSPKIQIHPRHVPLDQQQTKDVPVTDTVSSKTHLETTQQATVGPIVTNESKTVADDQDSKHANTKEHIPYSSSTLNSSTNLLNKSENLTLNNSTVGNDSSLLQNEEKTSINNSINETSHPSSLTEPKIENSSNVSTVLNTSDLLLSTKNRQICWHLPKSFEPSIELLENQLLRTINIFPDYLQTIFFARIDDREVLLNTMWFISICTMCFLFSFFFLSMGTKRLKQSKQEKEVRARCQQLQQYNNQIELERATFERQNQKLSDDIDELKALPVHDSSEDIFALREECNRFQEDLKIIRTEKETLQQDIDFKHNLIQNYEFDIQRQVEATTHLNNENLQLKQELDKARSTITRFQSNDISLENFERSQEIIQELKSEITQLKQDKFTQKDQLQDIKQHMNQLSVENNQLTLRMKQLKTLLEQREQIIKNIQQKINEEDTTDFDEILSNLQTETSPDLLSTVDDDIEKSNQHIQNLHNEIDEKTRRIKELDLSLKQEKDRCREVETKLKVVLELRERDAHLHIRQLGQTDAELRKARTDTDRVKILQQQLDLKQQQFDDVQKVLSTEQIKFNEECSKLQHETHEKWMEVKRLTRELDVSKKECESLRKQITKYSNNERSSQEKTMIKPVPQFLGNTGETETNGSSPIPYQQGDKPIDNQRNDSGATSPEMYIPRPPFFGLPRPPFYHPPFMPPPPSNPFMLHPRFPMPPGPHGMLSPLSQLTINGNDTNTSEIMDSTNFDTQLNGIGASPVSDDKQQTTKPKKSLKKKKRISTAKEDV